MALVAAGVVPLAAAVLLGAGAGLLLLGVRALRRAARRVEDILTDELPTAGGPAPGVHG
ncbi:hypothetical protein [Amycolatopsis sp. NBRC 101858]|uniref:hypothetical protein n=1 Tax=Amycolatopsis sp. NBRC 101858 TaxID=3032200 RepID=UPI00255346D4|nr:hypothetical protein [Amycolatopsis sp. NBRC 101858]